MNLAHTLDLDKPSISQEEERDRLHLYINLKLAASGQPTCVNPSSEAFMQIAEDLLNSFQEKNRLLATHLCPVDRRIQNFIDRYLADLGLEKSPSLPVNSFVLDQHGVARELSLPEDGDEFISDIVSSYRVAQGVLHNPASDRRTTKGSFHIAEGGLPIPGDKKEVPKYTFARLLEEAFQPPSELLTIPFTSGQPTPAQMFVSLLLRPCICPEIPGREPEKSMEIRFFAPASLVSNLDFVESIFGNGGNPGLPECDAALDVDHWSGHSGCVILAPHLVQLTKKALGLPHQDQATERQQQQGMCWSSEDERYNDGHAFKITARDESGVIITLLADNYYGYCKKEVKTQISYAANLFGLAEEEHSGGALAFQCRSHGDDYGADGQAHKSGHDFEQMIERYGSIMTRQPEGYAVDNNYPEILYLPQVLHMEIKTQSISWEMNGKQQSIQLQPDKIYMLPNGYRVEMMKHPAAPSWRLVGTDPVGVFCHKPCTVSGGGKSEISKSLGDTVLYGPMFVDRLGPDLDRVQAIFDRDFSKRFKPSHEAEDQAPSRKLLSARRSLGSAIKLLTPSSSYTDEFNQWLETLPPRIQALTFLIKRFYQSEWGADWRKHLSVDKVDGAPAHELKLDGRHIIATYLRVGFEPDGKWRTFKLRQDFMAAEKIQMEDDISVSVVVPASDIQKTMAGETSRQSVKLVKNCEYRLFQRPDDAILPGFDNQAEADIAQPGNFLANFEPLRREKLAAVVQDVLTFSNYTPPMHDLLLNTYKAGEKYVVSSAHARLVNGIPSKNPRYLQPRPDLANPVRKYAANMGARLHRQLGPDDPISYPVDAVLTGRRNNPPEPGIRSLAVYNPIHYQELPELFMDFICSLTGKSPSTTGAGSEGALTKGPFNALRPTADLNNTLVSYILTGYPAFSSSAGHIGPNVRVNHDISLLIPEIWARLTPEEADPTHLIDQGYLEPLTDFEHNGKKVLASRLGYRITSHFVRGYLGKIFDNPDKVFTDTILRPETQSLEVFVDGINNIVENQQRVAQRYLDDGSIDDACPPLRALLHIMVDGQYNEMDISNPAFRAMFTRENLLASNWYHERLKTKQQRDVALWSRHLKALQQFLDLPSHVDEAERLQIPAKLLAARKKLKQIESPGYLENLVGTIGADPLPCRSGC
ncbi:FIG00945414: hypothetical protein [hydrothermal vent metagenome]|uniref:PPi-type phosphoenolpyruvate carboxykinase lobe 2 domain-containing protein n=1 Tax=hydrothermal vent metagenome TaxID=652676 RepID=A0A3B1ASW8_9ZZZZ